MGILRLYLALCVVAAHSGNLFPWSAHNGLQSVEIFFLISGFYMALIASKYPIAKEFYASRLLRIYVPYWTILIGIVVVCSAVGLATGKWLDLAPYANYSTDVNGVAGTLAAAFSNLTGFGIDWFCFLAHEPGSALGPTAQGLDVAHPLSRYIVINPAWSISVELTFYLFVPFLNRCSTRTLVLLTAVSLGSRVIAFETLGLLHDPWTYRFTPFAMAMFLMGMIACRVSKSADRNSMQFVTKRLPAFMNTYCVQVACLFVVFWAGLQATQLTSQWIPDRYANLVSYFGWAAFIPVAFALTRTNKLDRWLGELSYPVYLVHYCVVSIVAAVYTRVDWLPTSTRALLVSAISIGLSIVLLQKVVLPLERRRATWAKAIAGKIGSETSVSNIEIAKNQAA